MRNKEREIERWRERKREGVDDNVLFLAEILPRHRRVQSFLPRSVCFCATILGIADCQISKRILTRLYLFLSLFPVLFLFLLLSLFRRLSTIRNADKIFVIDGGEVVQEGTHDELLTKGGLYAQLWSKQRGTK